MKKFIVCFATLSFLQLNAQENTAKPACLKPCNIHLMTGMSFYTDTPLSWEEMYQVAPNSQLLQTNFTNFHDGSAYGLSINSATSFSALAEFVPYDKKTKDYKWYSTVRGGFIYRDVYVQGPSYYRQTNQRADTIVTGSETYYVDSISSENYFFSWSGQTIGADVSQVFHTNDQRLFSFWAGYGIQLSMGVNNYFHGTYNKIKYTDTYSATGMNYISTTSRPTFDDKTETIRTKRAFVGRIYFPIGIQWRLSRKQNFMNKIAISLEMRASMDIQTVPGLDHPLTRFYYNQNAGLKYYFHNSAK